MRSTSVVIPAAGRGTRLGLGPKAWLKINGAPILSWVIRKAIAISPDVIVAVAPNDIEKTKQLCKQQGLPALIIKGGLTRQDTVLNLIIASQGDIVLIHDVARPFATTALLRTVATGVNSEHSAAGAFLANEVPTAIKNGKVITAYRDSGEILCFQSPQAFERNMLLPILRAAKQRGIERQSTAQHWLDAGYPINPIPGEKTNIKLTTPEDLQLSQSLKIYLDS